MDSRHLVFVAIVLALGWAGVERAEAQSKAGRQVSGATQLPVEGEFPSLSGATGWLNSPPLTPKELRGKVVLVDIWTYTCVNWLRTLPYVRAWAKRYGPQGLVVVGVHSPEFPFEHQLENVRWAASDLRVEYPIAIDNDFLVWRAFENEVWPALYLIDAQGRIRLHQFGEGGYQETEHAIQELLREAGKGTAGGELSTVRPQGLEVAADWDHAESPETYLGYAQAEGFASPGGQQRNTSARYELPSRPRLNQWGLSGEWTIRAQGAALNRGPGKIVYRFHARDLNIVLGPAAGKTSVPFRVLLDGKPPGAAHGVDVDEQGRGTVTHQQPYQLIRQPLPIVDRLFQIEFEDGGVEGYVFTFG